MKIVLVKSMIEKNSYFVEKIYPFLSTLLIIFLTDSLLFSTSDISILNTARKIVPLILAVLLFISSFGKKNISAPLFLICVSILISMLFGIGEVTKGAAYITQISLLLFAYEYSKTISFHKFSNAYIIIMRIIAIVSLVGFFFRGIIVNISFIPTIHTGGSLYYKTLFFTNLPINNSYGRRNFGPFWEPGAFQFYLNIALLFTLMRNKKYWVFDTILFLGTAITTFSGAALVPMPFVFLAFLLNKNGARAKLNIIALGLLMLVGIFILYQYGVLDSIINKLNGTNNESYSVRMGSLIGNLKSTFINPFFGISPDQQYLIRGQETQALSGIYYEGNTNTFSGLFASFGIFVGLYYLYRGYMFTYNFTNKIYVKLLILISLILATSNEEFGQSITFHTLLFIGGFSLLDRKASETVNTNENVFSCLPNTI